MGWCVSVFLLATYDMLMAFSRPTVIVDCQGRAFTILTERPVTGDYLQQCRNAALAIQSSKISPKKKDKNTKEEKKSTKGKEKNT